MAFVTLQVRAFGGGDVDVLPLGRCFGLDRWSGAGGRRRRDLGFQRLAQRSEFCDAADELG
ncbi:hypothetical protein D3C84_655550 [compost metagenome]